MSFANFYQNGTAFFPKEDTSSITLVGGNQQITHSVDTSTGNYIVRDANNNVLLAFDKNNNLISSSVLTSINNNVAPLTALVSDLSTSFINIGGSLGGTQSSGSVSLTTLQNQIATLQTYVNHMQSFMHVVSQALHITDPNTGMQFNFSPLE